MAEKIKITKLNRDNWSLWRFQMSNYFAASEYTSIITGELAALAIGFALKDAKVRHAIGAVLDEEHLAMVLHCATGKQMWDTLVAARAQNNETNVMNAQLEWHSYHFKAGQTCSEYLSGLNVLRMKLKNLGSELSDSHVIAKILSDLPKDFDNFRDNWRIIATETPALNMTKFTGHLLTAETSRKLGRSEQAQEEREPGEAIVSKMRGRRDKKDVECFRCHKKGHFKSECPQQERHGSEVGSRASKSKPKSFAASEAEAELSD